MRQKNFRSLCFIEVDKITPNESQPRKTYDPAGFDALCESIRANGIIQPLCVRKSKDGYILVSGERRLRGAKYVGLKKVPCIITETDNRGAAILALIENIQRENLDCFEEADGIYKLVTVWGVPIEDVAFKLGISQSALTGKMQLLKLSAWQRERIKNSRLTTAHAKALARIDDDTVRDDVLLTAIARGLTATELNGYIDKIFLSDGEPEKKPTRLGVIGDYRLVANTITRAVDVIKSSGINATAEKTERDNCIEYKITVFKSDETFNEISQLCFELSQ